MHIKHIAFPFANQCCSLNNITVRRAAGLRGYFHHFRCGCYYSCLPVFEVNDCGSWKGCMVKGGAYFSLTARQSMVKVDVAQVFWRPFWQTHFVVIVDHPPAGTHDKNIENTRLNCSENIFRGLLLSKLRSMRIKKLGQLIFFPFSLKKQTIPAGLNNLFSDFCRQKLNNRCYNNNWIS